MNALPPPALRSGRLAAGVGVAWLGFWLLMTLVGVQAERLDGGLDFWRPVVAETSSMLVASAIGLLQWRWVRRLDGRLDRPWQWFARALAPLPLVALGFVGTVYAIRHGVYAWRGQTLRHEPWPELLLFESLKFAVFYVLFAGVLFGVRSYLAWNAERLHAERQARLADQARLLQLTQQLQPHFLFNALNTVSSLIPDDPERAERLLGKLALLLRAATDAGGRPEQPLADELALLEAYVAIMVERFGDRVRVHWSIDDAARACRVPTLGLQPLVENCFVHVVERRRAPTTLVLGAACADGRLTVTVADDGGRLDGAPAFGVGLGNLQRRLAALHGDAAALSLAPRAGGGVVARLELPCVH